MSDNKVPRFHNPYNFVPMVAPTMAEPGTPPDAIGLMYGPPAGHHRYHENLWNGHIDIEITTVTPLLLPDAATVQRRGEHQIFDVRLDPDGKPLLPVTTLKGALRSAYEAITNSRMGVFGRHDTPPARRMLAREGLHMVPLRILETGRSLAAEVMAGTNPGKSALTRGHPLFAAWLPIGRHTNLDRSALHGIEHGTAVTVRLQQVTVQSKRPGQPPFLIWEVVSIVSGHGQPKALDRAGAAQARGRYQPTPTFMEAEGYLYRSGWNIENKHDERVFFSSAKPSRIIPLSKHLLDRWEALIRSYREQQGADLERPSRDWPDRRSASPVSSRHVWAKGAERLRAGDLCYGRLDAGGKTILELSPVSIGRELGHQGPAELLDANLLPATSREHLSPADRVFGWVNGNGSGAYKGHLRIHSTRCANAAVERFDEPLPLAILSSPKLAQARFYLARDAQGTPVLPRDDERREGCFAASGATQWRLRGRKVFLHHAHASAPSVRDEYWRPEGASTDASRTQAQAIDATALYREYVRLRNPERNNANADEQNRSIRGWVSPGARFRARVDVTNINAEELGALLWLLDLGEGRHHRVGGGKPLGFGSVRIGIDRTTTRLSQGASRRDAYKRLAPERDAEAPGKDIDTLIGAYWRQVVAMTKGRPASAAELTGASAKVAFEEQPHIKAWLKSAVGFTDWPTHYPRVSVAPDPAGQNFKWFVANARNSRRSLGRLDDDDPSLPINP